MGAIADAIAAYAQPLIDSTDGSIEQVNKALGISQACWNLAILPEEQRSAALEEFRRCFQMDESDFVDFQRSIVAPMIRRHEQMFSRLHQRGALEPPHWEPELPRTAKWKMSQETPAEPGRYDPCPCNSGKKYKFCCGRRYG